MSLNNIETRYFLPQDCESHLFTNFNINILHSSVRSMGRIPGILVLNNSKTYGKFMDKFLYKCIQ